MAECLRLARAGMAQAAGAPPGDAAAALGKGGKGIVKGKGKGKGSSLAEQVQRIGTVLVNHERSLNTLVDRCSYVFLLWDEAAQQAVLTIRGEWRCLEKERRDAHAKAREEVEAAGVQPQLLDHPLTASQRSLVHAALLDHVVTQLPAQHEAMEAATALRDYSAAGVDKSVFRLKARYDAPKAGRVWLIALMTTDETKVGYRDLLDKCCSIELKDKLRVTHMRSQDGPTIKLLLGIWSNTQGGNVQGQGDGGDYMDGIEAVQRGVRRRRGN
jgi:hypothetical protein